MRNFVWVLVLGLAFGAANAGAYGKNDILKEMEPRIAACIGRQDTAHPIFHGCVDWHSAVHGHWALFRIARALGTTSRFTTQAERSLSAEKLRFEERQLAQSLMFENPYGRAWFLRLAIDFERWATAEHVPSAGRLRSLADLVSSSILTYFSQHPITPSSPEYGNASWAFYQAHSYYEFTGNAAGRQSVQNIVEDRFLLPAPALTFKEAQRGFFSLFGNWIFLVAKTQVASVLEDFLSLHPIRPSTLGIYPVTTAHSLGLTWSRAWAFSALERKVTDPQARAKFAQAFQRHVVRGMENHNRYKDRYGDYGHWIPQFAVYALTEALD